MIRSILIDLFALIGYTVSKRKVTPESLIDSIRKKSIQIILFISPDLKVLQGPFKGLKYPGLDFSEATKLPKFVGSYEAQLHPLLERIINKGYTDIIDVGSAEGYYAVGLALRMPGARIHAYDINQADISFCMEMAKLNGVQNISFNKFCSPDTLIQFPAKNQLLVFCDAEGYELELFTEEVVRALPHADFLIEMHDLLNPSISATLMRRFSNTHKLELFNNRQAQLANFTEVLSGLSEKDKEFALNEHRGGYQCNCIMEWAYFSAK